MNREQAMVTQFSLKFGRPLPDGPTALIDHELRVALIQEELDEFKAAAEDYNAVKMIDGIADMLYVVYGAAVEMGIDIEPFFAEVHRTNMLKEGGTTRADGKILKPPGWQQPALGGILLNQMRDKRATRVAAARRWS